MTIVNIYLTDKKANVGVDTGCTSIISESRIFFEGTKAFPMMHSSVLVAGRGEISITRAFFHNLFLPRENVDFDYIDKNSQSLLSQLAINLENFSPGTRVQQEIYVIGWSVFQRKMAALLLKSENACRAEDWTKRSIQNGNYACPWTLSQLPPNVSTHQQMIQTAEEQVKWMRKEDPTLFSGGRLAVYEITEKSIMCDFSKELSWAIHDATK